MRAAVILGLGCSPKNLKPFQPDKAQPSERIDWRIGMPSSSAEADVILLFGGDGTIHRHLAQLAKLALPVLIVPAGSGNDFARALGLQSVRDSLVAWRKFSAGAGNVRDIDLGIITELDEASARHSVLATQYFACVAGVGLDAEVARRANGMPRWLRGHGGYAMSLVPTIFSFAPVPMKICIPDEGAGNGDVWATRSDQSTILAAFANAPLYGGAMKIAPRAKIDDGRLDVCVVAGIDPFKLFCLFPTVYSGRHLTIREVDYFSARRIRIQTEHPLDVYADGEYVCRTPVEVAIEPGALRVITP
jgi:diacylglycerol kinase (ATP)